jgi:hypothetical protein
MIKVRILDRCEFCDGEAYVFVCELKQFHGESWSIQIMGETTSTPPSCSESNKPP